jgi:cysteine synthase A
MEDRLGKGEVTAARDWADRAIAAIEADQRRSADTHLWKLDVPALTGSTCT